MKYVIAPGDLYSETVSSDIIPRAWPGNLKCAIRSLSEEQKTEFGVHPLTEVNPPAFSHITHDAAIGTPVNNNGVWEETWVITERTPEEAATILARVKTVAWAKIKKERDTRKNGGILVADKWYHSDTESRIQQIGLFIMGASVPAVNWKTMDGSFVVMSQAIAGGIFQGTATLDGTLFAVAEAHRVAMEASDRPDLYDFSGGWPAKYEE